MDAGKEVLLIDRKNARGTYGPGRGRAGGLLEKGHLAEKVIGPHSSQDQFVAIVAVDEDFNFALLDDEHAGARISLPEDDIAVTIFLPQDGHADALTCANYRLVNSVPNLSAGVNSGKYLAAIQMR